MNKQLTGDCLRLFISLLFLSTNLVYSQVQFKRSIIDNNLRGGSGVYAVDMDNDGDVDIVAASYDGLDWYQNNSQKFSKFSVGAFTGAWAVYAADVDNDGDVDVLGASSGVGEFGLWKNDGRLNFSKISLGLAGGPESVHAKDLDGDGDLDILGAAWGDDEILWWKNKSTFSKQLLDGLNNAHSVYAADLDNDGDIDGIACGVGGTYWYRNNGSGVFTKKLISSNSGWCVFAADVDGDGDNDVLRTQRNNGDVVLFKNSGNGNFSEHLIEPGFGECWSVVAGDVDGDGNLDIAAAGFDANKIKVWFNTGNGNFGQGVVVDSVDTPRSVCIADIDNDGDGDIVAAIRGKRVLALYEVPGTPAPAKSITITNPNGGENLVGGTDYNINWDSSGNISDVRIEYSNDNGTNWSMILNSTTNDGHYIWNVPGIPTSKALTKITDANDNSFMDMSDGVFTIEKGATQALSFTDITLSAGTGGPEGDGKTGGHSAIFSDVNGDNLPDLLITMLYSSPMEDLFFRNKGGNVFASEAALRGIADIDGGSHGATFADLDNDGDYDLLNGTTYSSGSNLAINNIYLNSGNGFFSDVTASTGIPERAWPTRGTLAFDMDKDGDLDLFCVTNFEGTDDPPDERNEVYRNNGNMNFSAINSGALYTAPAGQGATDTDFDGDGDIDVIAANRTGDVNILRNDGSGNFTLVTPASIGIGHQARDGITMGDVDNDGDLDMLLTGAPNGYLYRNNGNGTFSFIQSFVETDGYMGGFADLDNDGDLDLVFAGDSKCYLNNGNGNFTAGPTIPVAGINDPRAIAFADIDNDGDLDFAFSVKRSRNWLIRNNHNSGKWLKVKLVSLFGQAGAFGAKTKIYPAGQAGGFLLGMRESRSSNGYLGQNDPVLHFGLGTHSAVDVIVTFLDGTTITQTNVSANQTITVDVSGYTPQLPVISSFNPSSGPSGIEVTITGNYFIGTNEVTFNGVSATTLFVDSDNQIRAEVPEGASTGKIRVTNSNGSETSSTDFILTTGGGNVTSFFDVIHDAYVRSSRPTDNYGASDDLKVRRSSSSTLRHSYLKFNISGISGAIQSAKLKLYVTNASNEGGSVYLVSNNYRGSSTDWTEDGLIWNNAPEISGQPLSMLETVNLNEVVEIDVTGALSGNGEYSFAIKNNSSDIAKYSSKEGVFIPKLEVVSWGGGTASLPDITSFNPNSGLVGTEVTIFGSNFIGTNAVFFNGILSTVLSVDSDTQIKAIVPAGAATGRIRVNNSDGSGSSAQNFTVLLPPSITSFTPTSGPVGMEVTIIGNNFTGLNQVYFNEVLASEYNIISASEIRVVVPLGTTTGRIKVRNSIGTTTSASDFTLTNLPNITAFSPLSGTIGTEVTITGNNFSGTTNVSLNGSAVSVYSVIADTEIRFSVPANATSGKIGVTNGDGNGTSPGDFSVILPPVITSFNPTSGLVGLEVTISGDHFFGTTAVYFNGILTSGMFVDSKNQVRVIVPAGATSGPIRINNPAGSATSTVQFTVTVAPSNLIVLPTDDSFIRSNYPDNNYGNAKELRARKTASADQISYLKFNVSGLGDAPESAILKLFVKNEGSDGGSFYLISNNYQSSGTPWTEEGLKTSNAPAISGTPLVTIGAVSLNDTVEIDVTSAISGDGIYSFGIKNSSSDAVWYSSKEGVAAPKLFIEAAVSTNPVPIVTSFTPSVGMSGTVVTILGSNFTGVTGVSFNGVLASVYSVTSDTQFRATVPSGASTGKISVSNGIGTGTSSNDFTVIAPPEITSFTPSSGPIGTEVTIIGKHFNGNTVVLFNGKASTSYSVISANELLAIVPSEATSGKIAVITTAGVGTSLDYFTVTLVPGITSFSPVKGQLGVNVTITGINFTNAQNVFFNGTAVSGFSVDSDTQIRTILPSGANTGKISVANNDGTGISSEDFTVILPPVITSFAPLTGPVGTEVIITGSNFTDISEVTFNAATASVFTLESPTKILVQVPTGATTGKIKVTNVAGVSISVDDYTVTDPPSTISLFPTHDSFARSSKASNNYGTDDELRVRNTSSSNVHTYLKFSVIGLGGLPQSAKLRLFVVDDSNDGGAVYSASNDFKGTSTPWIENDLIWSNAPEIFGSPLSSSGEAKLNEWIEFDVTEAITGNGTFTFALQSNSSNVVRYSSKEGVAAPELVLETNAGSPAVPSITSFTPVSGFPGTEVTIMGNNFIGISEVAFNGAVASSYSLVSSTQIRANVPASASTGKISVRNIAGTGISNEDFTVTVPSSSLAFTPIEDSFVSSTRPGKQYGTNLQLRVRQPHSDSVITYLKFKIVGSAGDVQIAKIRLFVDDASEDGGSIFSVSNNYKNSNTPWVEEDLIWSNAPSISGEALSSVGVISENETVEFDVTPAINGDGTYSFAIVNSVNNIARYSSKEGSNAPKLVIESGSASIKSSKVADTISNNADLNEINETVLLPKALTLSPNYPNPFNMETNIEYGLPVASHVQVVIYNILGQEVRKLVDEYEFAGFKKISWNAHDNFGREVGSGIYFIRLEVGKQKILKKIILQK